MLLFFHCSRQIPLQTRGAAATTPWSDQTLVALTASALWASTSTHATARRTVEGDWVRGRQVNVLALAGFVSCVVYRASNGRQVEMKVGTRMRMMTRMELGMGA